MALIIPKSVGGNDDFSVESAPKDQTEVVGSSELVIPVSVGGEYTPPATPKAPSGVFGQQLPKMSQFQQVPRGGEASGNLDAFGTGVKRGFENVGEGILQRGAQALQMIGIDTKDFLNELEISRGIQKQQYQPTKQEFPVSSTAGEIVGEAAAIPIPAAKLKTAAAAGGTIGALRFGEEGGAGELTKNILLDATFGLAGQVVADQAVSMVRSAARKMGVSKIPDNLFNSDGTIKPEAEQFLNKEGVSLDDLSQRVISDIQSQPEGSDFAQSLRAAQAKEIGVTELTRSDITQNFDDQSLEFNLSRQRGTPEAEAIRLQKAAQNQQIIAAGDNIIRGIGGEADIVNSGRVIQEALRSDKQSRREAINQLYNIAEKEAGIALPIEQEGIASTFADQDFIFGIDPDVGGQLQAVKKQLEAFSVMPPDIIQSAEDIKRIQPLTIGSAEQLRKNVRALISDTDTKSQRALLPIIESIDNAVDEIAISNDMGAEAKAAFSKARQARAEFGKRFEAKDIVQDIVGFKPGTRTDKIPPSVVFNKISNSQGKLENTRIIKEALNDAGEEGVKAWNDYKTTAMSELIGKGLTTGKTASGDLRFSGANFNKALRNVGDDTLKVMFTPKEYRAIKQLGRVSRDLTILQDGVFTPSGAQVENALEKISKLPLFKLPTIAGTAVNEGAELLKKGQRRKVLKNALNPNIDVDSAEALGGYSTAAINAIRLMTISGLNKQTEDE